VIRPYTPTSATDVQGHLDLIIKQYPNGPMSTHIHNLKVGESLEFKGPIPKYAMPPNKHAHVAMICGGTGITPMYQVIQSVFANPNESTKVTLIYANVTEGDILLRKELAKLENSFPSRFRVFYTIDKPSEKWQGETGFVSKELLKRVLPDPKTENVKVFVCGPPPMYKAISGGKKSPSDQGELTGYLKELGYEKDQVFKF
jgi:cytochrome-b5 reductase